MILVRSIDRYIRILDPTSDLLLSILATLSYYSGCIFKPVFLARFIRTPHSECILSNCYCFSPPVAACNFGVMDSFSILWSLLNGGMSSFCTVTSIHNRDPLKNGASRFCTEEWPWLLGWTTMSTVHLFGNLNGYPYIPIIVGGRMTAWLFTAI